MYLGKKYLQSKTSALKEIYLIRKAKGGDRDSFGKLYLAYLDQIYRYIFFRVGQRKGEAEDLTQEVFLKAWDKISTFEIRKNGSFQAWLYQIARNKIADHIRRSKNEEALSSNVQDHNPEPERKAIINGEYETLLSAINKLPKLQKEVVTLIYINSVSNKEAAKIIGKKDDALRATKSRALKNLKKLTNHEL